MSGSLNSSPRWTPVWRLHADTTELEVSVKDRAARGQKVTLECWIAGRQKVVTTSLEDDLHAALNDVRDDLRRRLNDAKTKQEPGTTATCARARWRKPPRIDCHRMANTHGASRTTRTSGAVSSSILTATNRRAHPSRMSTWRRAGSSVGAGLPTTG